MVGQMEKRFLLPGDPGWHSKLDVDDPIECAPPSNVRRPESAPNGRQPPAAEPVPYAEPISESQEDSIPLVRVGCIGRGNAGKTAIYRALSETLIGDFLPSGLHVDADDPREVARLIREAETTQRLIREDGLPPTLEAADIRYSLYEGAEQQAKFELREVIGQILTHTLPDSDINRQASYGDYVNSLAHSEALWTVVPCPPANPGPRERRRYANDLRITMAYLREAVRSRSSKQPVAVAIVLSKMDTMFANEAHARTALNEESLHAALGPLVDFVQRSALVTESAVIPVSAFGFGNAVIKEGPGLRQGMMPDGEDEPFGAEPIWVLREGAEATPFNLEALFLWTLLYGLRGEENTGLSRRDERTRRASDMLQADLESVNPWILPLK